MTPGKRVSRKAPPANVEANTSVRTLILGIDRSGRIVQHDRTAPKILARTTDDLLGVHLSDITANPSDRFTGISINMLLDAVRSEREGNAVLSIALAGGLSADAVVTAKPMQTGSSDVAAFVIMQIPIPSAERFVDPALIRDILLRDTGPADEDTLDFSELAKKMTAQLVPAFCSTAEVLVLESLIGDNEIPAHVSAETVALRRLDVRHDRGENAAWQSAFPIGEILRFPPGSPYTRCIETGLPVLEPAFSAESAKKLAKSWRRKPVSGLFSDMSMLVIPAVSKGTVLGVFCCFREAGTRKFDRYDMEMGMEFATRSAVFFNHATRYNREHATALTLQRAMLPTGLTYPSSIEVKHRYLPGSELVEVGGDWYESIRLPGARVALVVGDVAGHDLHATATMGRLRGAVRTLADVDLPPDELLTRLDDVVNRIAAETDAGRGGDIYATCVYAVYDPVSRRCSVARAGHPQPALITPDGAVSFLDLPVAPPLGLGGLPFESTEIELPTGSILALYTDGLIESRERDIDLGLDRLRRALARKERSLETACDNVLAAVLADDPADDVALLMARTHALDDDRVATWDLPADPAVVAGARLQVAALLTDWGLDDVAFVTELVVSELITNAIRYARSPIQLRLIHDRALICEVSDGSSTAPHVRRARAWDEGGRGLLLVSQLTQRWGSRQTPNGKTIWAEQALPDEGPVDAG